MISWDLLREKSVRISSLLAKVPSLAYGSLFLALIPLYAAVYVAISGDFYHSTSQHEPGLHEDANKILREIRESIKQTFVRHYKSESIIIDNWKLDFENVRVHSLKPEGDQVTFALSTHFDTVSQPMTRVYVRPRITIPLKHFAVEFPADKDPIDIRQIKIEDSSIISIPNLAPPPLKAFFPYAPWHIDSSQAPAIFPITIDLGNRIYDFTRATSGFPKNVSGSYWRMLYLSAITITTLGYGDILPITPRARFFVALEAVSGMIVVGLFLNELSQENKH